MGNGLRPHGEGDNSLNGSAAVKAIGITTLLLILVLLLLGAFCLYYVLQFRSKVRNHHLLALRDFNSPWLNRVSLIVFSTLWGAAELLRLALLRREGWPLHSLGFKWQVNACRMNVVLSMGLLEPGYFLSALFLLEGSLRSAPFTPRPGWNARKLGFILLSSLPVFLWQLFFVVVSPMLEFHQAYAAQEDGYYRALPRCFTRVFQEVEPRPADRVALCTYPLLSTLSLAVFSCVYDFRFLDIGRKVSSLAINRRLRIRLHGLVTAMIVLLPMHVIILGSSVLFSPNEPVFAAIGFLGFLTTLLCIFVGQGLLVIKPTADALAVPWSFERNAPKKQTSQRICGPEDEEIPRDSPVLVAMSSLAVMAPERGESRGCSRTFLDKMAAIVDQEPGFQLLEYALPRKGSPNFSDFDTNGMQITPSASPALPGKPLPSHRPVSVAGSDCRSSL